MITIKHFPAEPHSLSEMVAGVFQQKQFQISIEWYYTPEADLRVRITINGEERDKLECTICAWLSANRYLYEISSTTTQRPGQVQGMRRFALTPIPGFQTTIEDADASQNVLDKAAMLVLATGILKTNGGALTVMLCGAGGRLRAAVSITSGNGTPREADFAFSSLTMRASDGIEWFDYRDSEHGCLLTMPYCPEEGASLITGFGGERQALPSPSTTDVSIGHIFNSTTGMQLCFTPENWRSSTCIFGAPGYGKSTLVNSILAQAYAKQGISFLVIEPKHEYRSLKTLFPELRVIPTLRGYNPLMPPKDSNPYDWCEVVLDLLALATPMQEDSPLPDYIRQVYYKAIQLGNMDMGLFLAIYDKLMESMHFVGQAANFVSAGRHRIESLFRCFCGPKYSKCKAKAFDISRLMDRPAVIEIGNVPTLKMTSLLTYFVVAHLKAWMAHRATTDRTTHCLVLEEAHSVLSPILNETVRNDIANLLAEGRSRGLSVIVIDQIPSRIDQAATDLCGNAFSLRVISEKDRAYAGTMLGANPAELNNLQKHSVMVRTNSMFQPETVHVEVSDEVLHLRPLSDEEVKRISMAHAMNLGDAPSTQGASH